ncbi:MAG: hypothetical protein AB7U98_13710 [Candidatus Nitrosocosmicus sp.]
MALTPEETMRVEILRRKALDGTITIEEQREAIVMLRQGRVGAQIGSTASRTKKAEAKAPVDTAALLKGLMAGQVKL